MPTYDSNGWNTDDVSDIINSNGTEFDLGGLTRSGGTYNSLGYDVFGWNSAGINKDTQGSYNLDGEDQAGDPVMPLAVGGVTATIQDITHVSVEWTASSTGGNGLSYVISDGISSETTTNTNIVFTYENTNGQTYVYDVQTIITVTSLTSDATASNAVVYQASLPLQLDKPTMRHFNAGGLFIEWVINSLDPYPNTGYTVTLYGSRGGVNLDPLVRYTADGSTLFIEQTGLSIQDIYYSTVIATNGIGSSAPSELSDPLTVADLPGPPTGVTLAVSGNDVILTWAPPEYNGFSEIVEYKVYNTEGVSSEKVTPQDGVYSVTLNVPTTQIYMTAINGAGESLPSDLSNVIELPTADPQKLYKPTLTTIGTGELLAQWADVANTDVYITGYTVTLYGSRDGVNLDPLILQVDLLANEMRYAKVVTGLQVGDSYYCTVYSFNSSISYTPSDPSDPVIVADLPGSPTGVTLAVSGNDVILTWTSPAYNGYSEVSSYDVYNMEDVLLFTYKGIEGTSIVFSNPATQVYMTSKNGAGYSLPSEPSNVIELPVITGSGPPSAPRNITVVAGTKSADVSWEAPTSSGGADITGYIVTSVPDNKTPLPVGADVFSVTMTKLITGTSYTFRVFAINSFGYSGQSNAVIPYVLPSTPKIGVPELGNLTVTLNWTAVSVGTPITGYKVTRDDIPGTVFDITGGPDGTYAITEGLVAGTPITFSVTSTNENGDCLVPAYITVSPISNPEPPAAFVAYVGKIRGTAVLYWIPPSPTNGGTPLTGYVLTYNSIVINLATATSFMVYVVDGAPVEFSLVSKNKIGLSEPVTASVDGVYLDPTEVTPTIPDPPPHFVAYVGKTPGTVNLHWLPLSPSSGGMPLTGYILTYNGITTNLAAGALTFSDNVVAGQGITFKLVSKNKIGESTELLVDLLGGGDVTGALFPRNGGGAEIAAP